MTRKNLKHMYAMTDVNTGDRPSGTIVIVSLCKTAEMSSDEFPCSCETILKKSYMDDISESVKTREEASTLTSEIDKIHEHDCLRIKGWAMPGVGREKGQGAQKQNHEDQHLARGLFGTSDDAMELERVLGMGWNMSIVKLNFSKKEAKDTQTARPTREQISASIPEAPTKRMK